VIIPRPHPEIVILEVYLKCGRENIKVLSVDSLPVGRSLAIDLDSGLFSLAAFEGLYPTFCEGLVVFPKRFLVPRSACKIPISDSPPGKFSYVCVSCNRACPFPPFCFLVVNLRRVLPRLPQPPPKLSPPPGDTGSGSNSAYVPFPRFELGLPLFRPLNRFSHLTSPLPF